MLDRVKCPDCGMPTIEDRRDDLQPDEALCNTYYEALEKRSTMTVHTQTPWHIGMKPGPAVYGPKGEQIIGPYNPLDEQFPNMRFGHPQEIRDLLANLKGA